MKCAVHPDEEASGFCRNCGKAMCPACVRPVRDVFYCEECLARVVGLPQAQPPVTAEGISVPIQGVVPPPITSPSQGSAVLAFLLAVSALLVLDPGTRVALYVAPVWFAVLWIGYARSKRRPN